MEDTLPPLEQLRWRCRRGMLELDVLLESWLDHGYADSAEADQRRFIALLEEEDPLLNEWFLGASQPADKAMKALIEAIRHSVPKEH